MTNQEGPLTRYAWLSIAAAIVTILMKSAACLVTSRSFPGKTRSFQATFGTFVT